MRGGNHPSIQPMSNIKARERSPDRLSAAMSSTQSRYPDQLNLSAEQASSGPTLAQLVMNKNVGVGGRRQRRGTGRLRRKTCCETRPKTLDCIASDSSAERKLAATQTRLITPALSCCSPSQCPALSHPLCRDTVNVPTQFVPAYYISP